MLTDDEVKTIREFSQKWGPANCWTGTAGTAANYIRWLLAERDELLKLDPNNVSKQCGRCLHVQKCTCRVCHECGELK
jgi:hypothetical protein